MRTTELTAQRTLAIFALAAIIFLWALWERYVSVYAGRVASANESQTPSGVSCEDEERTMSDSKILFVGCGGFF